MHIGHESCDRRRLALKIIGLEEHFATAEFMEGVDEC